MAEEADVDLVEVAPNARPPVCRLMDYGKFRYQEQKKAQEQKAKQKVIQITGSRHILIGLNLFMAF